MNPVAREAPSGNGRFAAGLLDPDVEVPANVTDVEGQAAPRRYGVYRNNVVVGLMEAVRSAFPAVAAIMGEANFDRIARNFIAFHPPRSAMMQAYGAEFADFLAHFPPMREARYLADLARVERLFLDAWHADDAEPLTAEDLAALSGEDGMELRLAPHPALGLLSSPWPVAALMAHRDGSASGEIDLAVGESVIVTRPLLDVIVTEVEPAVFQFARLLAAGETLGIAAQAVLDRDEEADIGAALALFLQLGVFRRPPTVEREVA